MSRNICINYLPYRRKNFSKLAFHWFSNIDKSLANKIQLNILDDKNSNYNWESVVSPLLDAGINVCVLKRFTSYLSKIHYAAEQEFEYSIKMDEDCFLSPNGWNSFLNCLNVLSNPDNLVIAPSISNGIPTVDLFIDNFLNIEEKEHIGSILLKTTIGSHWGCNYGCLDEVIKSMNKWDSFLFYEKVKELPHFLKGVHPVRFSFEAQNQINNYILKNYNKLLDLNTPETYIASFPYFCNSFFAIKTETWKKIVFNRQFFRDDYDEIPLNLYRDTNNLNLVFIKNVYCVHTMYNTIYNNPLAWPAENDFYNQLEQQTGI